MLRTSDEFCPTDFSFPEAREPYASVAVRAEDVPSGKVRWLFAAFSLACLYTGRCAFDFMGQVRPTSETNYGHVFSFPCGLPYGAYYASR